MRPPPDRFYRHRCIISHVVVEQGRAGGDNPTYGTPSAPAPCKLQQYNGSQFWGKRSGDMEGMGAVTSDQLRTVRYKVDPGLSTDDEIKIYATDGSGNLGTLISTVFALGPAQPLRFDNATGQAGAFVGDAEIRS